MFGTHGEYNLQQKDDILIINSKGPFNTELVNQFSIEIDSIIQNLPAKWGQIVFLYEESLLPPDAEKALQNACLQRRKKGLKASAIILVSAFSNFTMRAQISRIYDYAGIQYQFFDSMETAEIWVKNQLKLKPSN